MKDIGEYRSEFPITEKYVFFNNAAVSSPPLRVVRAVEKLFGEFSREGIARYPRWMEQVDATRALFARLVHADPSEVCFTGNTSEGLGIVAGGMDWKPGDKVLVPVPDFPSNVYPWVNLDRRGVEAYFFRKTNGRFGAREIEKALRPATRLLAVSATDFATGFRCNLEELGDFCRRRGLLLCVDGIQSLGAVPVDVKKCGVHFLAAGGHKWLLSTMGIGALYISREAGHLVHPARVGWRSVENENDFYNLDFKLKSDARRFEPGTLNIPGITALGAALGMLLEIGIERIYQKIAALHEMLRDGLGRRSLEVASPSEPEHRSGILSFIPENAEALFRYLLGKNVLVSQRGSAVRLAPHFYNDESDVEKFFRFLDSYPEGE